jgi:hypothetical protein
MIWHIFKKDVRLAWRLAAGLAGLHWTTIIVATMMFTGYPGLRNLAGILLLGGLAATGLLIVAVVQHDPIPGVRQDWLVRPIRRRDLVLAKVLFAALMVQLPIFVGDVAVSLASGFSLSVSLSAAFERFVVQMLVINLPFLAFASITQNLLELVSGAVVVGLAAGIVIGLTPNTSPLVPLSRTGLSWIVTAAAAAVVIPGGAAVLRLQYFGRRTVIARILTGCSTALILLTPFIPWQPAFALQRSLASAPESSRAVDLNFDPAAGRFHPPPGALTQEDAISILTQRDGVFRVYLPFRITGLPPESSVVADHSEVRLVEANGRTQRLQLSRWNVPPRESGAPVYPTLEIPAALYRRIKDQPVRLEVAHWLTLVEIASSYAIPAVGGELHVPGIGRCTAKINEAETAVALGCLEPGAFPPCYNTFLEHLPTHQRNPDRFGCGLYSFAIDPLVPLSLTGFGSSLPFRDSAGLAKYPVDGPKLRESRVVIQIYRVQDHFSRKLAIPEVRLSDWEAERSGS